MKNSTPQQPPAAVTLAYSGEGAPRVTAKGGGELAARIREIAKQHGVPIHQDPELTRILSAIELGDEIPPALFVAVAEVLAFAYRLSGKQPPLRRP